MLTGASTSADQIKELRQRVLAVNGLLTNFVIGNVANDLEVLLRDDKMKALSVHKLVEIDFDEVQDAVSEYCEWLEAYVKHKKSKNVDKRKARLVFACLQENNKPIFRADFTQRLNFLYATSFKFVEAASKEIKAYREKVASAANGRQPVCIGQMNYDLPSYNVVKPASLQNCFVLTKFGSCLADSIDRHF